MNDRTKITIAYSEDAQLQFILDNLKPILKGAKIRKNDIPKPYKHAYITIRNDYKPTK